MSCVRYSTSRYQWGDNTPRPAHALSILPRQLRDLVICPDERGVVNYVQDQNVMERDISNPSSVCLISLRLSSRYYSFTAPGPDQHLPHSELITTFSAVAPP